MRKISAMSHLIATWFLGCGFYKILVYKNRVGFPFGDKISKNAYSVDNTTNLLINTNRATMYFILSALFVIIGFGCYFCSTLKDK